MYNLRFAKAEQTRKAITNQQLQQIKSMYQEIADQYSRRIENLSDKTNISSILRTQYLREYQKQLAEMDHMKRYNEVKGKFVQQETPIRDSSGRRWVQCEICHEIKEDNEFSSYGGMNHVNLGKCSKCSRNSSL